MNSGPPSLTALFSASFLGGSELFSLEFLERARSLGTTIDAVAPERGPLADALEPLTRSLEVAPLPRTLTDLSRFDSAVGPSRAPAVALATARHAVTLRRALRRTEGPIVCFGFRAQLAGGIQPPLAGRPLSWVVHEVVPNGPFGRLWSVASRRARLVCAYSSAAAGQPALRRARVQTFPVRLDLEAFERIPAPSALRTLGLIGDLFPLKNHLAFIEAVARLRDQGLPVEGLIVGRGQSHNAALARYGQEVKAAVARHADYVRLVAGAAEDMPGFMAEIDLLLHLSTVPETFGRVCVEAMAAGRPVIAFDHGAVSELVPAGGGRLCPVGDMGSVERAVSELRGDEDRFQRTSETAREHARREYGEGQTGRTIGDALADFAAP